MAKVSLYQKQGVTVTPGVGPIIGFGITTFDLREVEETDVDRLLKDPRTLGVLNTVERKKVIAEEKAKQAEDRAAERKRKAELMKAPAEQTGASKTPPAATVKQP